MARKITFTDFVNKANDFHNNSEQLIHKQNKHNSYDPINFKGGHTECYKNQIKIKDYM